MMMQVYRGEYEWWKQQQDVPSLLRLLRYQFRHRCYRMKHRTGTVATGLPNMSSAMPATSRPTPRPPPGPPPPQQEQEHEHATTSGTTSDDEALWDELELVASEKQTT